MKKLDKTGKKLDKTGKKRKPARQLRPKPETGTENIFMPVPTTTRGPHCILHAHALRALAVALGAVRAEARSQLRSAVRAVAKFLIYAEQLGQKRDLATARRT